jgi:chromosome segregation ATPase
MNINSIKQQEVDRLSDEVLNAQYEVDQLQANVTSYTQKLSVFEGLLAETEAQKEKTSANVDLLNTVIQQVSDLEKNTSSSVEEIAEVDSNIQDLTDQVNNLVNQLIYTVELVNKASDSVVKKKAVNPLIPDDLATMMAAACKDANTAVALTLTALKSTIEAASTTTSANPLVALINHTTSTLKEEVVGPYSSTRRQQSLKEMIYQADDEAKSEYNTLLTANKEIKDQLELENDELEKAQNRLEKLKGRLSAAQAAL